MSHTNTTTNYNLPQFITTDKPAWLTDVNNAFLAIDTGMNNAQTKADTAYADAGNAQADATAAATAAAAADAKGAGAVASIADTFDPSTIYAVGAIVMYNNLLYICEVAVITPGPWTGSANWARLTVEDMYTAIKNDIQNNHVISAGDSISLTSRICPGIITSAGSRIRFWVDSAKVIDTANINDCAISGTTFRAYSSNVSTQIDMSDCTFSFTRRTDGLLVTADLDTALTDSGNLTVYFDTASAISFT